MKKIDRLVQKAFEQRQRELFAKMTTEELQFLADIDDWENSPFAWTIFKRVGGLWYLDYIKQDAPYKRL